MRSQREARSDARRQDATRCIEALRAEQRAPLVRLGLAEQRGGKVDLEPDRPEADIGLHGGGKAELRRSDLDLRVALQARGRRAQDLRAQKRHAHLPGLAAAAAGGRRERHAAQVEIRRRGAAASGRRRRHPSFLSKAGGAWGNGNRKRAFCEQRGARRARPPHFEIEGHLSTRRGGKRLEQSALGCRVLGNGHARAVPKLHRAVRVERIGWRAHQARRATRVVVGRSCVAPAGPARGPAATVESGGRVGGGGKQVGLNPHTPRAARREHARIEREVVDGEVDGGGAACQSVQRRHQLGRRGGDEDVCGDGAI